MDYIARVNPRYFAAIHQFSADGDQRHYLNGVCIQRHHERGVVLVGSDGGALAAIHDPDGWIDPSLPEIILDSAPRSLLSACLRKGGRRTPELAAGSLWVARRFGVVMALAEQNDPDPFADAAHAAERLVVLDGQYMDWRRFLREPRLQVAGAKPSLSSHLLARFDSAAKILCDEARGYGLAMRLDAADEAGAVLVRFQFGDLAERFVGMIMPMREEPLSSPVPGWVLPPYQSLQAEG